ncbi:MAG: F0F1 ATP synthase subunit A [Myxococcales bacterium]|nr:F0F1 ATP synthase subunit A [Myxococcales bacterium]
MSESPLVAHVVFRLGPVPFTEPVVTTWAVGAVLVLLAWLATRSRAEVPARGQAVAEIVVETLLSQMREILHADPRPLLPLVGTLFLLILSCNLAALIPGAHSPTGSLETPLALSLVVLVSVQGMGLWTRGPLGWARSFVSPTPLLLPLHLMSEVTRTLSMAIRLFGNSMSHELVLAVIVSLAGLLVPVPLQLLGLLIGLVQAYIFAVLATVYLGGAIGQEE